MSLGWKSLDFLIKYHKFCYKAFEYLQPFFKKDRIIIFESFSPYSDLINVSSFVEYLSKNKIKHKFVYNYRNKSFKKTKTTINCESRMDFIKSAFWDLLKAHTVVTSVGLGEEHDYLFQKNKFINYIYIDHGVCLLKSFKFMGFEPERFNYIKVVNSYEQEMILNETEFKQEQIINAGLPRFDKLKKIDTRQKSIFLMFTWRKSLNNENFLDSLYFKKFSELLKNEKFNELIKKNNIKLKIALHPCMNILEKAKEIFSSFENSKFENIETSNISKNIAKCNLLITDYSSLFFDFAYLNTPVIFYRFDSDVKDEIYLEKESIKYAMTKDKYLYKCVYDINSMLSLVEKYIENSFQLEEKNMKKNDKLFEYIERGKCCENLYKIIMKLKEKNNAK